MRRKILCLQDFASGGACDLFSNTDTDRRDPSALGLKCLFGLKRRTNKLWLGLLDPPHQRIKKWGKLLNVLINSCVYIDCAEPIATTSRRHVIE
jgi:hypothetical protein